MEELPYWREKKGYTKMYYAMLITIGYVVIATFVGGYVAAQTKDMSEGDRAFSYLLGGAFWPLTILMSTVGWFGYYIGEKSLQWENARAKKRVKMENEKKRLRVEMEKLEAESMIEVENGLEHRV